MNNTPYSISAGELAALGASAIPGELLSSKHLVYSSPATLAFNSPGAQGFGVKRAGLAVPDSVMLLVSPGCCGRNTSALGHEQALADRFYYLLLDETDIVTGRHLTKIPEAAAEVCASRAVKPSAVMICITCVDALLGTDMERVCRRCLEVTGVPAVPCYMYALTREGRLPPMAAVRKAVYSLLEKSAEREPRTVNILGYFSPLEAESDLFSVLSRLGIRRTNQLACCRNFDEYRQMSRANFNLVLNHEARHAAADLEKRLGMPSIELLRLYQPDKIANQYRLLASALGAELDISAEYDEACRCAELFREKFGALTFSVGEWCNADPFELSLALLRMGFRVSEIFCTIGEANFPWLKKIAALSPATRLYSNLAPSMLFYREGLNSADVTIGRDAAYYHPSLPAVHFADETQPFGFSAVTGLFKRLEQALTGGSK